MQQRYTHRRQAGFTLVEVVVTVALIAIASAVVIPAVSNVGRAEMRSTASKLSGMMRRVYSDAALTGQTHRIIFDLDENSISVEATEQVLDFDQESGALAEAADRKGDLGRSEFKLGGEKFDSLVAELMAQQSVQGEDDEEPMDNPMNAFLGIGSLAGNAGMAGNEGFASGGDAIPLEGQVELMDVWVAGMDEPKAEGKAYLYFFPHGYTQNALIHLTDPDNNVYTVKVYPLTGKTAIEAEYVEIPK